MKRIILMLAVFFLMINPVSAKNITVTGLGATQSAAETAALREAIEQTVGTLVDANTLVQNFTLVNQKIYTQSRGFITNYTVVNRFLSSDGIWNVTIDADVDVNPNSKLMSELTRLGIIDNRLRNPRIAIFVPEQHIQRQIPDPAGETAIAKALIDAGFSNVIEVGSRMTNANPLRMTAQEMTEAARQFNADIMIVGEAFSEGVGDAAQFLPGNQRSGVQACRARVEAKLFVVRGGQMIAADGKYGSGLDVSEAVASKKALAAAGKQMGEYFVEQLLNLGSGNRQQIELVVFGAGFSKINEVQSALAQAVGNFNLSSYEGGRALFTVQYGGTPQNLFDEIQANTDADLELQSISYSRLTISVR